MPRADLSPLSASNRGTTDNLLMAGSTVKSGMDVKLEMRYGGQADAGSYSGHMGSIMDNGGAFMHDKVNRRGNAGGGSTFGGGGRYGANATAHNYGSSNPGGHNWVTLDKGANFIGQKLGGINNAMTQSRYDYNKNLIDNKMDETKGQMKSAKAQINAYNQNNVPVNRKKFNKKQKAFNAPAPGGAVQGPVMPKAGKPVNRIPTPWAHV